MKPDQSKTSDGDKREGKGRLGAAPLLGSSVMAENQSESALACSGPDTSGCPASAYDKTGRLTFSGTLLTMEDCSFENWFAGKTPQMRNWGKSILRRWREAGYPSLGECPPCGGREVHLLDFALGMMVGAMLNLPNS